MMPSIDMPMILAILHAAFHASVLDLLNFAIEYLLRFRRL